MVELINETTKKIIEVREEIECICERRYRTAKCHNCEAKNICDETVLPIALMPPDELKAMANCFGRYDLVSKLEEVEE